MSCKNGKYFYALIVLLVLISCSRKDKLVKSSAKQTILNTDEAFSKMSSEQGMKKAFIEYIDNEGVLLRPNNLPIVGADAIDFLSQINDTSFTLTWKPLAAVVSSSEDLGYTYGIYNLQSQDTVLSGTYVSIWKKQTDGIWKFVLDTGNPGTKDDSISQ